MFISILTIVCFYRYIVLIYIAIYYIDYNSYNIVTMYYIAITVYYTSKNSGYKDMDIVSNMAY